MARHDVDEVSRRLDQQVLPAHVYSAQRFAAISAQARIQQLIETRHLLIRGNIGRPFAGGRHRKED